MKTLLNVKIEENVKKEAKIIAQDFGLSMSALVNALLRQVIREKCLDLFVAPKPSKKLETLLKKMERDIQRSQNLSPKFSTGKKAIAYLDSLGL
jgi:addiction module RelB/DinJ family antitoxin